jgi:hypothetical protein
MEQKPIFPNNENFAEQRSRAVVNLRRAIQKVDSRIKNGEDDQVKNLTQQKVRWQYILDELLLTTPANPSTVNQWANYKE